MNLASSSGYWNENIKIPRARYSSFTGRSYQDLSEDKKDNLSHVCHLIPGTRMNKG